MQMYRTERFFQFLHAAILIAVSLLMLAPMIHVLAVSFSSPYYAGAKMVTFWPKGFNVEVYKTLFQETRLWRGLGVSVIITSTGTLLSLLLNSSIGFSLSRPVMKGRRYLMMAVLATFIIPVPLIPGYLVVRSLGLENTLWALIIPGLVGAFYIILMKTFFQGLSSELYDAAKIDGCSELGIYVRIVLPLSAPVIATIALYYAVGQWNSYFSALIYIRDKNLLPVQNILRAFVMDPQESANYTLSDSLPRYTPESIKAGAVIFTTIPILIVYPFLQKYFVKGSMLGSLKE